MVAPEPADRAHQLGGDRFVDAEAEDLAPVPAGVVGGRQHDPSAHLQHRDAQGGAHRCRRLPDEAVQHNGLGPPGAPAPAIVGAGQEGRHWQDDHCAAVRAGPLPGSSGSTDAGPAGAPVASTTMRTPGTPPPPRTPPVTGPRPGAPATTSPLLSARDLVKSYRGADGQPAPVLRGISLEVAAGELVAVVGPSGSGKSTLLHCLSGLERPTSGSVRIAGTDLTGLSRSALARVRRERVGFVFQAYDLISSLTAWDNVALPARLARRAVREEDVERALAHVGLSGRARAKPAALSGGQQQRVAVARALAVERDLVFADEPTGALDTTSGAQVLALLRAAASGARSVVLVTHDLQAAALADRVLVLRDGLLHVELRGASAADLLEAVAAAAVRG